MTKIKVVFIATIFSLVCIFPVIAGTVLEGVYHSSNDFNVKIVIFKTDNGQYLIRNEAKKWKALVFKGVGFDSKTNKSFDYYKGVIHWDKSEKGKKITDVGFIHLSLMKDGKSIIATHRWNFWKDAKNSQDPWKETWTKE